VSGQPKPTDDATDGFLALYDASLPYVYGYLLARCGRAVLAEELTADTMLAAVDAVGRASPRSLSTAWLLGIARHKLVDYWRRLGREERSLRTLAAQSQDNAEDPWDVHLDGLRARQTLDVLAPHHRAVLTLRYLDDLPVAEVAEILDRTVHATEALLVRARTAFRRAYTGSSSGEAGPEDTADA
jgi:RNA polymerase sigma-70 factor (ECF subfamily)